MKPNTSQRKCGLLCVSNTKVWYYCLAIFLVGCLLSYPVTALPSKVPQRPLVKRILAKVSRPIRNKLWPNTLPDLAYSEPLPPGPLGCPFRGLNPRESSPDFGPGVLFVRLYQKLQRPKIFKFFSKDRGIAIVSGYATSKAILSQEFDTIASQMVPFTSKIVGTHSLRCVAEKKEHGTLRKLIGMAVQPTTVNQLIPNIQQTAETLIDQALTVPSSNAITTSINVEDLCLKYTLEIACRHIVGLQDLPEEEVDYFLSQVKTWISAVYTGPSKKMDATKKEDGNNKEEDWVQARNYLVGKIEDKLAVLERNGPDSSTVSGMYFAQDPEDPNDRRLSKEEIIDNTLLLILAGSETSAGTLTNCLLLLGLSQQSAANNATRKNAWQELVQEQTRILQEQKENTSSSSTPVGTLDRVTLDQCTYLDGVVRESLRLKPIIGGSMRGTKTTIVVDGYQIPAGWGITYDRYNTHLSDPITFQDDLSHMNVIRGFDPTRWHRQSSDDNGEPRRPGQEWIPFGIGPRFCLGYDLAMVEMKIFLAVLARKMPDFELSSPVVQDLEWASDIQWREKAIIPVPVDGVILRPVSNNKKVARKDQEWTFERIYKINKRLGCAD